MHEAPLNEAAEEAREAALACDIARLQVCSHSITTI